MKHKWWSIPVVVALGTIPIAFSHPRDDSQPETVFEQLEAERNATPFYRAYFPDVATGRKAAISFHGQMMEAHYDAGYLVMELNAEDMAKLKAFGFRFEYAADFVAQRDDFLKNMQAAQVARAMADSEGRAAFANATKSISGYSCYETVEETATAAQAMVTAKPNLASIVTIGSSWQKTQGSGGYDLNVLKLTNSAITGTKPKLFVQSAIHAREYATAPLVLEFARWLVNGYGVNADATWILDHHEIHLLFHMNPDGRKKAETGLSWRKNVNNNHCANTNTRGVDLNRNYSLTWNITNGTGSSGVACNETFRGPSAASEPEVVAVENYVRGLWPDSRGPSNNDPAPVTTSGIHLDIHSYSQLVLWPWGFTSTAAPNGPALQTLGRKFAWFNNYTPQQSIGLYATDGTSDSVSYGELGVPAFTVELGTSFFESCTTFNSTIKPNNLQLLIYAAKVVRTPYVTPGGPDVTTVSLSNNAATGGVTPGTVVTLSASATDTRFNNSNGTEATQSIAAAEAYIDIPPWQSGATPIALTPSDGAFNATTEALTGSLNTAGLSLGNHIVYVRAQDASGTWGAVSASFLNVTNTPINLVASFTNSCTDLACTFNGSGSSGSPTSYSWNFGDGTTATGATPSKTYTAAGVYTVTLTVGNGSTTASTSQNITVTAPAVTNVAEVESNNTLATAQVISPNPALVQGTMGSTSDNDYYRWTLPAGKTLTAKLTPNVSSDYDLRLYNSGGTLLASSTLGTGAVDTINYTNSGTAAITLNVRVNRYSGLSGTTGTYTLNLSH